MQVGDLVTRRPEWGEWTKHNPWMLTAKDLEVGIIVAIIDHIEVPPTAKIMWANGCIEKDWTDELVIVNESR